jgi:hypothetical protein
MTTLTLAGPEPFKGFLALKPSRLVGTLESPSVGCVRRRALRGRGPAAHAASCTQFIALMSPARVRHSWAYGSCGFGHNEPSLKDAVTFSFTPANLTGLTSVTLSGYVVQSVAVWYAVSTTLVVESTGGGDSGAPPAPPPPPPPPSPPLPPAAVPGTFATLAGTGAAQVASADGVGTRASLFSPEGVAVDAATGDAFVLDCGLGAMGWACLVRKVTPLGVVSTFAGHVFNALPAELDGVGTDAAFYQAQALAISPVFGAIFVADTGSSRIRRIHTQRNRHHVGGQQLRLCRRAGVLRKVCCATRHCGRRDEKRLRQRLL